MLAGAFMMLLSSAFLMLRLGPPSGSFPRPLSPEEERKYVDLWLSGDIEARNVLIEHNLRLVRTSSRNTTPKPTTPMTSSPSAPSASSKASTPIAPKKASASPHMPPAAVKMRY